VLFSPVQYLWVHLSLPEKYPTHEDSKLANKCKVKTSLSTNTLAYLTSLQQRKKSFVIFANQATNEIVILDFHRFPKGFEVFTSLGAKPMDRMVLLPNGIAAYYNVAKSILIAPVLVQPWLD
jgi:hypothetical protein